MNFSLTTLDSEDPILGKEQSSFLIPEFSIFVSKSERNGINIISSLHPESLSEEESLVEHLELISPSRFVVTADGVLEEDQFLSVELVIERFFGVGEHPNHFVGGARLTLAVAEEYLWAALFVGEVGPGQLGQQGPFVGPHPLVNAEILCHPERWGEGADVPERVSEFDAGVKGRESAERSAQDCGGPGVTLRPVIGVDEVVLQVEEVLGVIWEAATLAAKVAEAPRS